MKIQLVVPNQDLGMSFNTGQWWPHGLLSIASYAKQKIVDLDIQILDGEISREEEILRELENGNADIVGVSCNSFNYKHGIEVAKSAKALGKKVYLGGPHPSALAEKIMKRNPFVDAIVRYDGEKAFYELISGKPCKEIQNLVYREGDKIRINEIVLDHIYQKLWMDWNLVPLSAYQENHHQAYPFLPKEVILYFTHVGCKWRETGKGCIFCAIPEPKQIYQDPRKIWDDIRMFKDKLGIRLIKDYGDTITASKGWLNLFLEARPSDLQDILFMVYGAARDVDDEMADILVALNVRYIFIGFESGNDRILKNLNKGVTAKKNWDAARRIINRGIGIFSSYILGCPGETDESMDDTYKLAKMIVEYGKEERSNGRDLVELSNASPFIPFPGTRLFHELFNEQSSDGFDCKKSIQLHLQKNTSVSYDKVLEMCAKIAALSPQKNYLGWEVKE